MATVRWLGNAPAVSQVTDYLFAGTWETSDVITLTIGQKVVSTTATSTTEATIVDALVTLWNNLSPTTHKEFTEITASRTGDTLRLTADTAGKPFTCTVATTETGGGAADDQTIDGGASSAGTNSTASAGPNHWDSAMNWSGGAVPVNSDDVFIENSAVDILYGLAQTAVTLTSLNIPMSYTGKIGNPRRNAGGYEEYRDLYLAIKATTVNIGYGTGAGSGRIKLDQSSAATTLNISGSGSPAESGLESILWKGTESTNVVNIRKGSFGAAVFAGETATIATLRSSYVTNVQGDVQARLGAGVTLTTVNQSGGTLEINAGFTTLNMLDGQTTIQAGNVTTISIDGGTCWYNGAGTLTTINIGTSGTLDLSRDLRTIVITNAVNINAGGAFLDPFKRDADVVIDLERCGGKFRDEEGTTIHLGTHLRLTRGSAA
jgi:trimeric autotransporter adhesin